MTIAGQRTAGRALRNWKLEDAQARFSELVRLACSEGPQRVSVRGKEAVVVIGVEELLRIAPTLLKTQLVTFLEGLHLDGLDLTREPDLKAVGPQQASASRCQNDGN